MFTVFISYQIQIDFKFSNLQFEEKIFNFFVSDEAFEQTSASTGIWYFISRFFIQKIKNSKNKFSNIININVDIQLIIKIVIIIMTIIVIIIIIIVIIIVTFVHSIHIISNTNCF